VLRVFSCGLVFASSDKWKKACVSNMSGSPVISVEGVSKRYLVGHQSAQREAYRSLRDLIGREVQRPSLAKRQIWLADAKSFRETTSRILGAEGY